MKELVRSTLTGISCIKCDNIIPTKELRFVDSSMHYHFNCTTRADVKRQVEDNSFYLINKFK